MANITITPAGQLYLCKTPLENDYKNQLTFANATAQYNYFVSYQPCCSTYDLHIFIRHLQDYARKFRNFTGQLDKADLTDENFHNSVANNSYLYYENLEYALEGFIINKSLDTLNNIYQNFGKVKYQKQKPAEFK